ncbi:MAG: DNA-formamidopyrimidine glycosylase [Cyanobacteria bacterium J06638_22]
MPELPEVETVRRGLNDTTLKQMIVGGEVLLERTVAYPTPSAFLEALRGQAIAHWHRRGKYLIGELAEGGGWLGVHLRMTGQLFWTRPDEPVQKHCRVRLFMEDDRELRFVDQRTFGQMWAVPAGLPPEQIITGLQRLGPEPLSDAFTPEYLQTQLHRRVRPIKNALLDQSIIAGVGNIYADEALFLSGIRPQKLCSRLRGQQFQRIHAAIRDVLTQAIASRGTTFSDFRDVEGINGNYGQQAWVYDREGEPCRVCGAPIQRLKLAGRSAHFCKHCQK